MPKSGPVPTPGADGRRRVPTPRPGEGVTLPPPSDAWMESTAETYRVYAESEVARLLRLEDVPRVLYLFDLRDKRERTLRSLPDEAAGDPRDMLQKLQALKILDSIVARNEADLGIGPDARRRLGIGVTDSTAADQLAAFMESTE